MILRRSVGLLGCVLNVTAFCVLARPVALCAAQTPEEPNSGKMNLSQVIGEARKNCPAIQAAQAQQRAAQGAIGVASRTSSPEAAIMESAAKVETARDCAKRQLGYCVPMMYFALTTALLLSPGAAAIALMVVERLTTMGP